jgi:predicted metalloprotease
VAVDVASDWQTRFPEAGDTWQMAHYNFVQGNQTADSPCGIVGDPDDFPNASNPPDQTFACSSDLTAYMSVDWVRDHIWDNSADPTGAPDTMGVGAAIAHEFQSHHGTPDQRAVAFAVGYNTADISQCTLTLDQTLPMSS